MKFFNVAGMGLEGTTPIEKEYTVTKNAQGKFDPIVIAGIPAGTQYTISEISASDNAVLESVDVSSGYTLEENINQLTHIMRLLSLLKCQVL